MRRSLILLSRVSIFSLMMGVSSTAIAEDAADQQEDSTSPIIVTGTLENPLVTTSPTASRLGLTPLETPASVYTVDRDSIRALGDVDFNEAVSRAPGLAQSQTPGNGTLSITSRGSITLYAILFVFPRPNKRDFRSAFRSFGTEIIGRS